MLTQITCQNRYLYRNFSSHHVKLRLKCKLLAVGIHLIAVKMMLETKVAKVLLKLTLKL